MQDYRDLDVWRRAHALAVEVHRVSSRIPRRGNSALITQIRRAAGSVPANIVEGCGKLSRLEFARYLQSAVASSDELEYHLLLATDTGLLPRPVYERVADETRQIARMLVALADRVRNGRDRDEEEGDKDDEEE